MAGSIQEDAAKVLDVLANAPRDNIGQSWMEARELSEATALPPAQVNDAVTLLVESGYVEWRQYIGTAPYLFQSAQITPTGRYEHERVGSAPVRGTATPAVLRPPIPVGSPYGFEDEDWEFVSERRALSNQLLVVMGYQFESEHYEAGALRANIGAMFQKAVDEYNRIPGSIPVALDFGPLEAGYGEHVFNEIARDIISADIAVFETSDLNPNVMIEMGVALTWGVRVLPVKAVGRPKPPSDISGQTWADYRDSGSHFPDPNHERRLVRMVERAFRKKPRTE